MIDTLILRIHNVEKYPQLYAQYYKKDQKSVTTAYVDETTGELMESVLIPATIFGDTNRVLPLTHRSSFNLPSSHYTVSYSIGQDEGVKYVEFNLSIPKAIFTTNVFQFINYYNESVQATWERFNVWLRDWMRMTFIVVPIDDDIEINRLDFCYNQFFLTKDNALTYLESQQALLQAKARSSGNAIQKPHIYQTSLQYVTDRYTWKIYHKGTEFEKNDYRQLTKEKGNPLKLPCGELLEVSQRILRYEMTFRRSMFSYLLSYNYFTKDQSANKSEWGIHQTKIARVWRQLAALGYNDELDKFRQRGKKFTLGSMWDNSNMLVDALDYHQVTFDFTFFNLCFETFWKKVIDWQLSLLVSPTEVISRIQKHNAEVKMKNNFRKLYANKDKENKASQGRLLMAAMLAQNYDLNELKPHMSNGSFYRIVNDLKKIGISKKDKALDMPLPRLDYHDYKTFLGGLHTKIL